MTARRVRRIEYGDVSKVADASVNGRGGARLGSDPRRDHDGEEFIFECYKNLPPALWGSGPEILWPAGEGLMIASEQGTGKTTVAGQLSLHRIGVRTESFLGYPVMPLESGGQVVYLAMDRPPQIARSFRRMISEGDRQARRRLRERLSFWQGPLPFNILKEPGTLADWVDDLWPNGEVVVMDSVKDLAAGKSLKEDEVATALNSAWQSLMVSGRDPLLLHHHRKTGAGVDGAPKTLADVFGSTFLTAGLGSVITFQGQAGATRVKLRHLKPPHEPVGPLVVTHNHARGVSVAEETKDLLVFLAGRPGGEGASLVELSAYFAGSVDRAALERTRRQLKKLEREGTVAVRSAGRRGGRAAGGRAGGGSAARWVLAG